MNFASDHHGLLHFIFAIFLIRWVVVSRTPKRRVNPPRYVNLKMRGGKWPVAEHRFVAEKALGRSLQKFEVVHHRNGIPSDNRLDNLCVMTKRNHFLFDRWIRSYRAERGCYPDQMIQSIALRITYRGQLLSKS